MAYAGYLVKLKGVNGGADESLPFQYIGIENYKITSNQRMEAEANRATTGLLRRKTVSKVATKIEFTTPSMTNSDVAALNTLLANHFTDKLQRNISIQYYDTETDTYREADCYMPDVEYSINHIDNTKNIIYYSPIRYAFIDYGSDLEQTPQQ